MRNHSSSQLDIDDFRGAFDALDTGCCVIELLYDSTGRAVDHRFLAVNAAFETQSGLVGAEGKCARELIVDLDSEWEEIYDGVLRTGVTARVTRESQDPGRWLEVSASRLGPAGTRKLVLLVEDSIAKQASRQAVTDASAQRAPIFAGAAAEIATWTWDVQRDVVVADRNMARLFAVSDADAAGGPIAAYVARIHPDDRERVQAAIDDVLAGGSSYEAEYRIVRTESDVRTVLARGSVVRDDAGRPTRLPGVIVDVTRRSE